MAKRRRTVTLSDIAAKYAEPRVNEPNQGSTFWLMFRAYRAGFLAAKRDARKGRWKGKDHGSLP